MSVSKRPHVPNDNEEDLEVVFENVNPVKRTQFERFSMVKIRVADAELLGLVNSKEPVSVKFMDQSGQKKQRRIMPLSGNYVAPPARHVDMIATVGLQKNGQRYVTVETACATVATANATAKAPLQPVIINLQNNEESQSHHNQSNESSDLNKLPMRSLLVPQSELRPIDAVERPEQQPDLVEEDVEPSIPSEEASFEATGTPQDTKDAPANADFIPELMDALEVQLPLTVDTNTTATTDSLSDENIQLRLSPSSSLSSPMEEPLNAKDSGLKSTGSGLQSTDSGLKSTTAKEKVVEDIIIVDDNDSSDNATVNSSKFAKSKSETCVAANVFEQFAVRANSTGVLDQSLPTNYDSSMPRFSFPKFSSSTEPKKHGTVTNEQQGQNGNYASFVEWFNHAKSTANVHQPVKACAGLESNGLKPIPLPQPKSNSLLSLFRGFCAGDDFPYSSVKKDDARGTTVGFSSVRATEKTHDVDKSKPIHHGPTSSGLVTGLLKKQELNSKAILVNKNAQQSVSRNVQVTAALAATQTAVLLPTGKTRVFRENFSKWGVRNFMVSPKFDLLDYSRTFSKYYLRTHTGETMQPSSKRGEKVRRHKCVYNETCSMIFPSNLALLAHATAHYVCERSKLLCYDSAKEGPYFGMELCRQCFVEFDTPYELTIHKETVHGTMDNAMVCYTCEKGFENESQFKSHMLFAHGSSTMPYSCPFCDFRSCVSADVMFHFRASHANSLQLLCPLCFTGFAAVSGGRRSVFVSRQFCAHLSQHVTDRFPCPQCRLVFTTGHERNKHVSSCHSLILSKRAQNVVTLSMDMSGLRPLALDCIHEAFPSRRLCHQIDAADAFFAERYRERQLIADLVVLHSEKVDAASKLSASERNTKDSEEAVPEYLKFLGLSLRSR